MGERNTGLRDAFLSVTPAGANEIKGLFFPRLVRFRLPAPDIGEQIADFTVGHILTPLPRLDPDFAGSLLQTDLLLALWVMKSKGERGGCSSLSYPPVPLSHTERGLCLRHRCVCTQTRAVMRDPFGMATSGPSIPG